MTASDERARKPARRSRDGADPAAAPSSRWPVGIAALAGVVAGVAVGLLAVDALPRAVAPGVDGAAVAGSFAAERGAGLGPDAARIGSLRVSVVTGTANGAGTDNPVLLWIGGHSHALSDAPERAFAPGATTTATFDAGIPRTLGELRRESILLTLHLHRAEVASSWYCERARIEVRLEGSEAWAPCLDVADVGWLSQDEPPRRSPAWALQ